MSEATIILTPNYFLYNDLKVYELQLRGIGNSADGYLYCMNEETSSRATKMNKIQLEGLRQVKKAIAQRREIVTDISTILTSHHWQAYPVDRHP